MYIVLILALLLSAFLAVKLLTYYCSACGLLHYLITEYKDELSDDKLKRLTIEAAKRLWK